VTVVNTLIRLAHDLNLPVLANHWRRGNGLQ
jgi:hypothetical protein